MRRLRRGVVAVETALGLPAMLVLTGCVLDYGWYLSRELAVIQVVRDCAHGGSLKLETADPKGRAVGLAQRSLTDAGFDPTLVTVTATLIDSTAGRLLELRITAPNPPLVGLVPLPANLTAMARMRLEDQ